MRRVLLLPHLAADLDTVCPGALIRIVDKPFTGLLGLLLFFVLLGLLLFWILLGLVYLALLFFCLFEDCFIRLLWK